jgi:hypothetical protein
MHRHPVITCRALVPSAIAAALLLAGCASGSPQRSLPLAAPAPPTAPSTTQTARAHVAPPPPEASTRSEQEHAVASAWQVEIEDFYIAGELGEPNYPPLLASWVPGGPVAVHAHAYLAQQSAMGIVGPSTWRIGDVRVLGGTSQVQAVEGCSYDPGSYYRATRKPAPAALGGGPGLTGYDTTMDLVDGRWVVDDTIVSSPASPAAPGPCHGF